MPDRSSIINTRHQLVERFRPIAAAWSVNGRDLSFIAGFDLTVEPGTLITVTTPSGDRLLAQVHEVTTTTRRDLTVELDGDDAELVEPGVRRATVELAVRIVEGSGVLLGRVDGGGEIMGFDDGQLDVADDATIAAYHEQALGNAPGIEIGALRASEVPARLRPSGFARHTFMCGQSGSGKTFSLGVILERLLHDTELPIVIVDPNSDYVNLGRMESRRDINRFSATPLSSTEYRSLTERYRARSGVVVASARRGDIPLRIHLSDLTLHEQALTMQLDPIDDADEYRALVDVADELAGRPYTVADVTTALLARFDDASRRLAQRLGNLGVATWSVWARADEPSLAETGVGHRALVLDTGSLSDRRERSVVELALLGRIRRRPERRAVALVIDEAHNVCPPDAPTRLEQAVVDLVLWIAGEGRKYGTYLLLSTQRPQKIHRNVLSQCDNLLLMRINSAGDLDELATVFSHVPAALIAEARSHRMGEMLAAGPIAPTPLRLQVGVRWTRQGGADLPTDWASPAR